MVNARIGTDLSISEPMSTAMFFNSPNRLLKSERASSCFAFSNCVVYEIINKQINIDIQWCQNRMTIKLHTDTKLKTYLREEGKKKCLPELSLVQMNVQKYTAENLMWTQDSRINLAFLFVLCGYYSLYKNHLYIESQIIDKYYKNQCQFISNLLQIYLQLKWVLLSLEFSQASNSLKRVHLDFPKASHPESQKHRSRKTI